MDSTGLDELIEVLRARGMRTLGPTVRDGAILHAELASSADLPAGWHDEQGPGVYRLRFEGDQSLFAWAVGPASWKSEFFPPREQLWRAQREGNEVTIEEPDVEVTPVAIVGARPCELSALAILDRVLQEGVVADPGYARRREGSFVVVVECGSPSSTCFCSSMDTGPSASAGFDLALAELLDSDTHRFFVRVGSQQGADVLAEVPHRPTTAADVSQRQALIDGAIAHMGRTLETEGLAELLGRNLEHPRWEAVAQRCCSCGNCTLVCPTCFCSDVNDISDLDGTVERRRSWSSCFDTDHSYIHGGPVRSTTASRYRQWLTHKLSTWWDQFDTSGCVGCGRCITWCPVGIDLTEEAAAIRTADGAIAGSQTRTRIGGPGSAAAVGR